MHMSSPNQFKSFSSLKSKLFRLVRIFLKGLLPFQKIDIDAIDEEAALTSQRCDKIVACRSSLSGMFYATILAMLGLMFLMFSIYNSNGKFFYSGSSSPGSTGLEWHQHVPMVP